jgi:predicted SAM-dependent methyltransferase
MKKFLHVGCGWQTKTEIRKGFNTDAWQEVRFDIDPNVKPDIVGAMTDMRLVPTASMDALYSSHNIEHVYAHEVPVVLREFHRVLKTDGFVVLTCPDIQTVCEAVVQDKLLEALYVSPAGPIAPLDILYGHRASMAQGNLHMAHKCGFTYSALLGAFLEAGFAGIIGGRELPAFNLWLLAHKGRQSEKFLKEIGAAYLP